MLRRLFVLVLIASIFFHVADAKGPVLKFGEGGKFKIAQFTDMHISADKSEYCNAQLVKTMDRLSRIVNQEKPDLLVFTGDIVVRGDVNKGWDRILDSLDKFQIPFCITFGNHDPEMISRAEMSSRIVKSPYCLNKLNEAGELADMEIEVLASQSEDPACLLYCMDSHDYSTLKSVKGYAWFTSKQVEWLRECCQKRTTANNGVPVNSLAFFHICLQEYVSAWGNPKKNSVGRAAEDECPGALNSGMFAAMVETGSVMGVFVGHDHDNDYVVAEKGIALGYGRFSGDDTTYNNLRPGSRLIVVEEGQRSFSSWILEDDGREVHKMKFKDGVISK